MADENDAKITVNRCKITQSSLIVEGQQVEQNQSAKVILSRYELLAEYSR